MRLFFYILILIFKFQTLRRQHMSEYEHHRTQCNLLQDKLNHLQGIQQSPSPNHQQKQKKKPRPLDQGIFDKTGILIIVISPISCH